MSVFLIKTLSMNWGEKEKELGGIQIITIMNAAF